MSDHFIEIIPEDPAIVPDPTAQAAALAYLEALAPEADGVECEVAEHVEFRDCGENFESVSCPSCGAALDIDWWAEALDADHDGQGFRLGAIALPCCGVAHTVHELRYEFQQGFSRFVLSAMNPEIGPLPESARHELERLLGCAFRVVYRHL